MILEENQLAKLTIRAYRDQQHTRFDRVWQAQFNPTEVTRGFKNRYTNERPVGASKPVTSYAGGEPEQLSLEFFFDGTGVAGSAATTREQLQALLDLTRFQRDTHAPYYLRLEWGDLFFSGVLLSADVTYTLFDREGHPVRARVKATFQEVVEPDDLEKKEGRQSPDLYQTWLVREGDTLDGIAHRVYGAAEFWRPVAEANRLANPRRLTPGTVLVLPPKAV